MSCGQLLQHLQTLLGISLLLYGVLNAQSLSELNSKEVFLLGLIFSLGLQNTLLPLQLKFKQNGLLSSLALLLELWTLWFRLEGKSNSSFSQDLILPAVSLTLFVISVLNILSFILLIFIILFSCAVQDADFQNYEEFIQEKTQQVCVVCLQDCREGERMIRLGCKHQYHAECIVSWLQVSSLCPLCKTQV